jgi:hypothetical protein
MTNSNPKLEVLTPQNSQLIFMDQQPQMAFGVQFDRSPGAYTMVHKAPQRTTKLHEALPPAKA